MHKTTLGAALAILFSLPTPHAAADTARTIIVLDGSGSMWGQIDGRPKLEIAREVLGQVLAEVPAERELGLIAYGHRRRGDCTDIELIVPPAPGTAGAIMAAANTMRFQGRTPLTDAVRQAARELNFTENPATVVLITDGIETCQADPCALGRELAAAGVGFTAHVVGFGMTAAEGAQVACLARETGGQYLLADDAGALAAALAATVAASPVAPAPGAAPPEPEFARGPWYPGLPDMPGIALQPTGQTLPGTNAPVAGIDFAADGTPAQCRALCEDDAACHAWRHEPPGSHFVAEARCFLYGAGAEFDWSPTEGFASGLREGHLALIRPLDEAALAGPLPPARVAPPAEVTVTAAFAVPFEGPLNPRDYIDIVWDGQSALNPYLTYAMAAEGSPATLRAPAEPGDYVVRYIEDRGDSAPRVLATAPLSVGPGDYGLQAAGSAMGGTRLRVDWTGAAPGQDWIAIAAPGSDAGAYLTWEGTPEDGAAVEITLPTAPGTYELRYVAEGAGGPGVQAMRPLVVTEPVATLAAPDRVEAGSTVRVAWTGPAHPRHYVTIDPEGAGEGAYLGYFYTATAGLPGELQAPDDPGRYELRFVLDTDGLRILARRPVEVVAAGAMPPAPVPAAPGEAPEPERAAPLPDRGSLSAPSASGLAFACPAEAPEPCAHPDPATGLTFLLAPGYGITEPFYYETAAGMRATRPTLDLVRLSDGATVVAVNPRQSALTCLPADPDRLCLDGTPGFEDQMALMQLLAGLAGTYGALDSPVETEGMGADDFAGTWTLRIWQDGHPRHESTLAVVELGPPGPDGATGGRFVSAPDFAGFAGLSGAVLMGFEPDGRMRLDLIAETGAALVLTAAAFGPFDWTGELAPPGPEGPAPLGAALSRVAAAGEAWDGPAWVDGRPEGMAAALEMGRQALEGLGAGLSPQDRQMLQILGGMLGGATGATAPSPAAAPSPQMQALGGTPLEGLSAEEALILFVPHLEAAR